MGASAACGFTGVPADSSADVYKWIWRTSKLVRQIKIALGDSFDISLGVRVYRAGRAATYVAAQPTGVHYLGFQFR